MRTRWGELDASINNSNARSFSLHSTSGKRLSLSHVYLGIMLHESNGECCIRFYYIYERCIFYFKPFSFFFVAPYLSSIVCVQIGHDYACTCSSQRVDEMYAFVYRFQRCVPSQGSAAHQVACIFTQRISWFLFLISAMLQLAHNSCANWYK
jgi:hypothetical protein